MNDLEVNKEKSRVTIFSLDGVLYFQSFRSHRSLLMMNFHPLFDLLAFYGKFRVALDIVFFVGQFYFGQVTVPFVVDGFDYDFGMKLNGFNCFCLLLLLLVGLFFSAWPFSSFC